MSKDRVIKDDLEIIGIFKGIGQRGNRIWCWQTIDNKRVVHFATVAKVDAIKKEIYLHPCNKRGFRFNENQSIFVFCKQREIASKVSIKAYSSESMIVTLPLQLSCIDKQLASRLELVEKDNESSHLHKRTIPRHLVKEQRVAGLKRIEQGVASSLEYYDIYDMSAGGMGLIIDNPAEFIAGEMLIVQTINNKDLDVNLSGTIISVRQIDDSDKFKVGVKFFE